MVRKGAMAKMDRQLFDASMHYGPPLDNVTRSGHNKVMMKVHGEIAVRIAEFKSHLSEYLRNVRRGHSLTLLDRQTPIARVLPYPAGPGKLLIRKPTRRAKDVRLPPPIKKPIDSLSALLEERQEGR